MQIRITHTAHKSTVTCLRAYYDPKAKRTRQQSIISFNAFAEPDASKLGNLTPEEQAELSLWIQKRDADGHAAHEKNTVSKAAEAIDNITRILKKSPDCVNEEQRQELEIAMNTLSKAIRKSRKLHP